MQNASEIHTTHLFVDGQMPRLFDKDADGSSRVEWKPPLS